jgi:hypothetical protein
LLTKLSAIDGHLIWIECGCGHHASLPVSDLLMGLSAETTVDQVAASARCGSCGKRGAAKYMRIVFKGGV